MSQPQNNKTPWYEPLLSVFFRFASTGILPASWFRDELPKDVDRKPVNGHLNLEMVSHCWNYSNLLAYQLSSFVNYPPTKLSIKVTVFYSEEDTQTKELLEYFSNQQIENVTWNWQPLAKESIFRRSIGRNMAALATQADWIWFTDCDIIFRQGCMDSLAEQLQNRTDALVYPREEKTTSMLSESNPILQRGFQPQIVDIDDSEFSLHSRDKAKGAFQIVHGDVARAIGYCSKISLYQTPSSHWRKTYEDKVFRWLLGTHGVPIDIPSVFQIRHVVKGRYKKNSIFSRIRSKIRRIQE